MCTCNIILIVVIWALLGLHSVWYAYKNGIKGYTITGLDVLMLALCFVFPIVTHFATWLSKTDD